jgi:hypothetical protein
VRLLGAPPDWQCSTATPNTPGFRGATGPWPLNPHPLQPTPHPLNPGSSPPTPQQAPHPTPHPPLASPAHPPVQVLRQHGQPPGRAGVRGTGGRGCPNIYCGRSGPKTGPSQASVQPDPHRPARASVPCGCPASLPLPISYRPPTPPQLLRGCAVHAHHLPSKREGPARAGQPHRRPARGRAWRRPLAPAPCSIKRPTPDCRHPGVAGQYVGVRRGGGARV